MLPLDEDIFWPSLRLYRGTLTARVLPRMLAATVPAFICLYLHPIYPALALEVGPVEIAGGALGLLMVLRTNAGYERWWEARRLWGGLTNASRNLVAGALAYGPADPAWRRAVVAWTCAYAHACRHSLRGERQLPDVVALLGEAEAMAVACSEHMPTYVAQRLAALLNSACRAGTLAPASFLPLERLRCDLIDCVGSCERIDRTPLPSVYVVKLRRFTSIYLTLLPLALVDKVGWATPLLVMLVAYPALGMDQIAHELQRPFTPTALSHLPLEDICRTIQNNALAALANADEPGAAAAAPAAASPAAASPAAASPAVASPAAADGAQPQPVMPRPRPTSAVDPVA